MKRVFLKSFAGWVAAVLLLMACGAALPARAADQTLYIGKMYRNARLLTSKNEDGGHHLYISKNAKVNILEFDPYFVKASYKGYTGYIKRDNITDVQPVDPATTPPYGVEVNQYVATVDHEAVVRAEPKAESEALITLYQGARLSFIDITDGWARIIFKRQYGYIHISELSGLLPVCTDVRVGTLDAPIAAYTSFYQITTDKENLGRMVNIDVACARMSKVYAAGESMNFNEDIGPYSPKYGYQLAYVLVDGKSIVNYGGGTCQVSSTLYNVVLQLPGIEVLQRRPHGPSGAKYLPHGVDAAVGNSSLNFRIRNNYDFPVRIDASAQDGALYISIYRVWP